MEAPKNRLRRIKRRSAAKLAFLATNKNTQSPTWIELQRAKMDAAYTDEFLNSICR